ncbi:MAG: HEAT repeat domain-containing protein [Bryobacterales bacterium]|nr:HEAT repeat domain-containing protein [Bryobacterales bacterium]
MHCRLVCLTFVLVATVACTRKSPEEISYSPQDSLKTMKLSDDFRVELFAHEPDVLSPVELAFDEDGRAYVAEMLDYPDDPPKGKPARSRIRLLEDNDGDGKFEKTTIFAEEVLAVSGIMPWKGGLLAGSAPDILWLKDTNGDGKADIRKVLYTGFPRVNQEGRITNPRLSVNNWIYWANLGSDGKITSPDHPENGTVLVRGTDFRFDPISGKHEPASGPTQYGTAMDDWDNRFITQNTTHIRHVVVPMDYVTRAPLLEVRAVAQDISDHGRPSAPMFPLTGPQEWRKMRTALRQQRYDENKLNRTEQLEGWFTAASGGTIYTGDAFPQEYVGNVFTGDVSGNLIHRDVITQDGATFKASRAKDKVEFIASTDVWFRPCNFANAPDGNLYVMDIYRQVIETPESIPEEIRKKLDFYNGDKMGRIFRIVPNNPRRKGNLKPGLGKLNSTELVAHLANPNGWHRTTAHRLLLERQDKAAVPALQAMANNAQSPEGRVRALYLLQSLGGLDTPRVITAMKDSDARIRKHALRLAETDMNRNKELADLVVKAATDTDSHVQFQAALTLGNLKDRRAFDTLLELSHNRSSDAWFRLGLLTSVANNASPFFHAVTAKGDGWVTQDMLVELSAVIGAKQDKAEITRWFAAIEKMKQPEQLMTGLNRGLKMVAAKRLQVPAVEPVLARMLANGSEPVQQAAWEVSRYFELASLIKKAADEAVAEALPVPKRVLAVRALRGGTFDGVSPVLQKVIQSHAPAPVEGAAVDSLAAFTEPAAGEMILQNWKSFSPEGRTRAVTAMLSQTNRIPMLLKAIEDGLVENSALDPAARGRLYENTDAAIAKKAKALLESSNSDRDKIIAGYKDALNGKTDINKGKKLFDEQCAKCHMPRRSGGRVGPDLSGINNKTKEELLTSILNPSYAIEPRFVNYVLTTKDGRMYDGVIANETPNAITLRGGSEEGDETVLRKNIAEVRASSVSLMPDGLEKDLTKQDIADIIAYLRGGL